MSVMQRLWIISLHLLLPVLHGDGGWTLIGTRCFHYSGEQRTYDDSVSYCEGMGSVIASIRGESENAGVTALIPFACGRTAYIGAETKGNEVWSWHDGTGWWQPHNNGGLLGVEDTRVVIKGNDRLWYDWGNGSALHGVLCAASFESPAVPIADNNVSTFCSNGWTRVGDRCFLYDGQTRGFGNSVKFCEGLYSRIASFHSEEENRIATALIPGRWAAWIGAQGDGHGVWSWRDGTPWWQPAVTADIDGDAECEPRQALSADEDVARSLEGYRREEGSGQLGVKGGSLCRSLCSEWKNGWQVAFLQQTLAERRETEDELRSELRRQKIEADDQRRDLQSQVASLLLDLGEQGRK
ncbi:unnamed protein product [Symbiodinium sp. KB8]|nr:unnamed protein product [Symbiodinium sp. KB8]